MHPVKCVYCKKEFDRDKEPFVALSARRFAHPECVKEEEKRQVQEEKDRIALENYIKNLFHIQEVDIRTKKLIETYRSDYKYTYSGILKTLIYWYEIKKNSIETSNGSIGIVPYIYQQSNNYYYGLWLAQQTNRGKKIEDYLPKDIGVVIQPPKRKVKKKSSFDFLDDDEVEDGNE